MQDKQALLQQWVNTGENVDAIETQLKISRSQEGELTRGRECLTIDEMKARGMSQYLIYDHMSVLTYSFLLLPYLITFPCLVPAYPSKILPFPSKTPSLLRTKIESVIKRGDGIADPDCPDDPSSTRFWVTTGARFEDREKVGVSMEATAAVQRSAEAVGQMLAPSGANDRGVSCFDQWCRRTWWRWAFLGGLGECDDPNVNLNDPNGDVNDVLHTVRSGWRLSCFDKFLHSTRHEVAVVQHVTSAQLLNVDWEGLRTLADNSPAIRSVLTGATVSPAWMGLPCPFCGGPGHWEHLAWECQNSPLTEERPTYDTTPIERRFGWASTSSTIIYLGKVQQLIWRQRGLRCGGSGGYGGRGS